MIVFVFGAALLAQGAYSFFISPEPYPALRMPGFGSAPTDNLFPITTVSITIHNTDGSTSQPSVSELMGNVRFSASRPTLDRMFRDIETDELDTSVLDWLRHRAAAVDPDKVPQVVEMCWQTGHVDVQTAELVAMSPCETTRIEV